MSQQGQAMRKVGVGGVVLLALAAVAQAQTAATSRDAVRKEAAQANKSGNIDHHGEAASAAAPGKPAPLDKKTATAQRTEVRKEAMTAQKSGTVSRGDSEGAPKSGAKVSSTTSREKVRKEASQANKAGEIEHHGESPALPPAAPTKR